VYEISFHLFICVYRANLIEMHRGLPCVTVPIAKVAQFWHI